MLPILRILPVGGVFLATILLVLALSPPDGSRVQMTPSAVQMRGAMIARGEHPEWRQFLMLAAIQRAYELNRLRELPDTLARSHAAPAAPKVAGLPSSRTDSDPDNGTGTINEVPSLTIPVDIGETSSTELPVATPEEQPPVIRTPQRVKSRNESRIKGVPRARRAKALAKPKQPAQFDFFQAMFGEQKAKQQPIVGAATDIR